MRELTAETVAALKDWAKHHAAMFIEDRQDGEAVERRKDSGGEGERINVRRFSRDWIMLQLFNITFKDEFEFIVGEFRQLLGAAALSDFEARLAGFPARSDAVFAALLEAKRPDGYVPAAGAAKKGG